MRIVEVTDISMVLEEPVISWIRDQKLLFEKPIDVIAKLWSQHYKAFISVDHIDHPQGIIVCSFDNNVCTTILVYGKNQLLELRDTFYELLKEKGIIKVRTYSHERSAAYERLIGMKHIYSYYEKEI